MPDDHDSSDEVSQHRPAASIAGVMAILLAYPLSVGPVVWLAERMLKMTPSSSVGQGLRLFYSPLIWLAEHSEFARAIITWYLSLFGVR